MTDLLDEYNIDFTIDDKTTEGTPIFVNFKGELRANQVDAIDSLIVYNNGILHATTAFGKTVAAIGLISRRKVNTLILVHTKALLNQWKTRLEESLEIDFIQDNTPKKRGRKKKFSPFGTLDSTGNTLHGRIDIALIQSCLEDSENGVKAFMKDYGMIIIDECHHVPAANFELVLRQINARYVYGLTATPTRKDGHQPIIYMQCGPIRYVADAQQQIASQNFSRILTPRFTSFRIMNNENVDFTLLCDKISEDEQRNNLIVTDAIASIMQDRTPIILSSRTKHVLLLANLLKSKYPDAEVIALLGSEKTKDKREKMELLANHPAATPLVIVAIDKYVGEGFDYPRLDTLLLAMPFSHKTRVAQYAGRLHRDYEGKTEVRVLDYVDLHVPLAEKMYRRRLKGYASIGYNRPSKDGEQRQEVQCIFNSDNYFDSYLEDIRKAQKSIVISMPKIWLPTFAPFLDVLSEKQVEGTEVAVFTTEDKGVERLQHKGISVSMSVKATIPCAIIDHKLLWYGSVNYLSRTHSEDHTIRIMDDNLVNEILNLLI